MKKKLIILITILVIIVVGIITFFVITGSSKNKYQNATEYSVGGENIPSVKTVLGDRKVIKSYHENGEVETLTLIFEDNDAEKSAKDYINYLLEEQSYLKMQTENDSIIEAAKNMENKDGLLTVDIELVDNGFKLIIKAGPGKIQVEPIE